MAKVICWIRCIQSQISSKEHAVARDSDLVLGAMFVLVRTRGDHHGDGDPVSSLSLYQLENPRQTPPHDIKAAAPGKRSENIN
jgi:hypothetical protein